MKIVRLLRSNGLELAICQKRTRLLSYIIFARPDGMGYTHP